jgi:hypothetical protein
MQNARCARVWPPRRASLPFRVRSLSQVQEILANSPVPGPRGIIFIARARGPGGLPSHFRVLILSLCVAGPHRSPDTLPPSTCLPTSPTRKGHNRQKSDQQPILHASHVHNELLGNYPFLKSLSFFCVSYMAVPLAERRAPDRGSTRARRQQKKIQNTFVSSNAPTSAFVTKHPSHQSLSGKSRSGRPVAVFGAPLNLQVACTALCARDDDAFVLPRRPSPHRSLAQPSPRASPADIIFPRTSPYIQL